MINIVDKENCVGCNACVQICPKTCISMHMDKQGFSYPKVDLSKCINCGLCEKVCPVINQGNEWTEKFAYAAANKNIGIKYTSSSGGVFYALSSRVINEGGVVFGARFNSQWKVVHDYTETLDGLKAFQGSKYLQSEIKDSFILTKQFLEKGIKVLFSGTPCQIAGLRLFLRKDYGNQLILVDVACHGVPSPLIWTTYIKHISDEHGFNSESITDISFRDKRNGWQRYGMRISYKVNDITKELFIPAHKNPYMQGFLKDLYIRPSCFACPAKCGKSGSHLTIADFWGIQSQYPELYEKGFYSLVISKSKKTNILLSNGYLENKEVDTEVALRYNPALIKSPVKPKQYQDFWNLWPQIGVKGISMTLATIHKPIKEILKTKLKSLLKKIIGDLKLKKLLHK